MNHSTLRKDPECENCGARVEKRFCSTCGQENVESRQSARGLMMHFFEDLTHYDGKFWKSIRLLLLRPGFLSKEYLNGKRSRYLPPVRMYIFISFITFFISPSIFEISGDHNRGGAHSGSTDNADTLKHAPINLTDSMEVISETMNGLEIEEQPEGEIEGFIVERAKHWQQIPDEERAKMFVDSVGSALPKLLIFFMPVFAFFLWFFKRRSRPWYFDHAIYTLHLFSFLLLLCCFIVVSEIIQKMMPYSFRIFWDPIQLASIFIGFPLYYLKSYYVFYTPEISLSSFLKASFIFLLEVFIFAIFFILWIALVLLVLVLH